MRSYVRVRVMAALCLFVGVACLATPAAGALVLAGPSAWAWAALVAGLGLSALGTGMFVAASRAMRELPPGVTVPDHPPSDGVS